MVPDFPTVVCAIRHSARTKTPTKWPLTFLRGDGQPGVSGLCKGCFPQGSRASLNERSQAHTGLRREVGLTGLSHLDFAELGEEAGQEGVVPCGAHTLCLHGPLGAFEPGKVESEAPQQGDVLRSVILTSSGLVFIHGHVENPMQTVLHPPMGAGYLAEVLGAERGAQQVVGGFATDLVAPLAAAAHAANSSQPRPGMLFLQPSDVSRDQAGAGLDAAVLAIDRGMADLGGTGWVFKEAADIVVQAALVTLQREHVIPALFDHLGSDDALTVECVGGDDAALERQQFQHGCDLVGLAVDRHLTEQQALLSRPGMDHMQRRLARDTIERAPQRLAVHRHHAPQALSETLHEAGEAGLERLWVEQAEHPAEGIMAGRAMAQAQKLAQVRRFDLPEQRHVRAILAARQQSTERDHQQLMQVVAGIVPAWVHNFGKAGDELFHRAASALDRTARLQPCSLPPQHPPTSANVSTSAICDSPGCRAGWPGTTTSPW